MNSKSPLNLQRPFQGKACGAALIEFAIVLPILIALIFGFTELGRALYQQNQLSKEVSIGARYVARYADAVTVTYDDGLIASCNPSTAEWGAATGWASIQVAETLNGLEVDKVDIEVETRTRTIDDSSLNFCIIVVTATMDFNPLFANPVGPFFTLNSITLSARTEERYLGN